jgi:hypothetical protein
MVADQQAQSEIKNFGEVQTLVSPPGWVWRRDQERDMSGRASEYFQPPSSDVVVINAFYRGVPVNDQSASALAELLKAKSADSDPVPLSADEIRSMSYVFGRNNVGDNQYTNDAPVGQKDFAVFHLKSAHTVSLNGRAVLRVVGSFQDENGVSINEYNGFFVPAKSDPNRIEELFFQAPTKDLYVEFLPAFEGCLESLKWRG